jgi:hypothetical protein
MDHGMTGQGPRDKRTHKTRHMLMIMQGQEGNEAQATFLKLFAKDKRVVHMTFTRCSGLCWMWCHNRDGCGPRLIAVCDTETAGGEAW